MQNDTPETTHAGSASPVAGGARRRITKYNLVAGQSVNRLAAISDGVFGVAMTLLVLNLAVPAQNAMIDGKPVRIWTDGLLLKALGQVAVHLVPYVMSFMTLGIFWVGQQTQLNFLVRSNCDLTWLHLGFLLAVTLMPFSTALLAAFPFLRTAVVLYWLNIVLLGAMLYATWSYAVRAKLAEDEALDELTNAVRRRIAIAQALYAFGALLCIFSTYLSIAVIFLVQLNYVIAPRIRLLYRL